MISDKERKSILDLLKSTNLEDILLGMNIIGDNVERFKEFWEKYPYRKANAHGKIESTYKWKSELGHYIPFPNEIVYGIYSDLKGSIVVAHINPTFGLEGYIIKDYR